MGSNNLSKKYTKETFKSIISDNNNLYLRISAKFSELTTIQLNMLFLMKLDYTCTEVRIILEVSEIKVKDAYILIIGSNLL
jgi:hypothetical protein